MELLLVPAELFTRFFLIMDIETATDVSLECSVGSVTGHSMIQNPTVLSGVAPQPVLHFKWLASIKRADVDLEATVEIIRVHVLGPAVAAFLFQGTSNELEPALVEVITELVCSGHPDHYGRGFRNHPETLFALAQGLFSLFSFQELANVIANGGHHVHKLVIGSSGPIREEFDDSTGPGFGADGEPEGAAHAILDCQKQAREIICMGNIFYPDRLVCGPNVAGQPLASGKLDGSAGALQLRELPGGAAP